MHTRKLNRATSTLPTKKRSIERRSQSRLLNCSRNFHHGPWICICKGLAVFLVLSRCLLGSSSQSSTCYSVVRTLSAKLLGSRWNKLLRHLGLPICRSRSMICGRIWLVVTKFTLWSSQCIRSFHVCSQRCSLETWTKVSRTFSRYAGSKLGISAVLRLSRINSLARSMMNNRPMLPSPKHPKLNRTKLMRPLYCWAALYPTSR